MTKLTKDEVTEATNELQASLLEYIEANKAEDTATARKMKAQIRLTFARDAVRSLTN